MSRAQLLWPTNLNCSWRKRVTSTKLNDNVSKLIDQRRNWNEHSYIPEYPSGTKLNTHFLKLNEEMTKMGGKTYIYVESTLLFWLPNCHWHTGLVSFWGGGGGGLRSLVAYVLQRLPRKQVVLLQNGHLKNLGDPATCLVHLCQLHNKF